MLSSLSIRWRLTLFHTLLILVVGLFIFGVTVRSVQTGVEETV